MQLNMNVFNSGTLDERMAEINRAKLPGHTCKFCRAWPWGKKFYLVTGDIFLKPGTQAVEVIDITPPLYDDGIEPHRFGPNYGRSIPGTESNDLYLVRWSDEFGKPEILCEDGEFWPVHFADLAITVSPPNAEEARDLYMDLLEQQFDN